MTGLLETAAADIGQREARRRALLDYAADCERRAWETAPGGASSDLYDEAKYARLAAIALAADA